VLYPRSNVGSHFNDDTFGRHRFLAYNHSELGSHERIDIDSYDARLPKTTTLTYLGMLLPDIVVGSSVAVTSSNDQSLAHDLHV
jgi:hypothetical protein